MGFFSKKTVLDAFSSQKFTIFKVNFFRHIKMFCTFYFIHGSVVLHRLKFKHNQGHIHIENIYSKKVEPL
jgi:hypothetical protein